MILLVFVALMALTVWKAYVLTVLWGWFITPEFGIAVPPVSVMWGILLIVGQFFLRYRKTDKEDDIESIIYFAIGPAMALAFGYVGKLIGGL